MTISTKPFEKPLETKACAMAFLVVSLFGFIDASYLAIQHYAGSGLKCLVFTGCDMVTTSPYSIIWNIPVALFGALYYLAIFLLAVAYLDTKKEKILRVASICTIAGLAATAWFLYVQAFILNAFCFYCILSALSSTLLFITGMIYVCTNIRTVRNYENESLS